MNTDNHRWSYPRSYAFICGQFLLVPLFLIDDVLELFAGGESLELGQEEAHRLLGPIRGVVGAMRREQQVFQAVEGVAVGKWFRVENVQRRSLDWLCGESTH